MPKRSGQEVDNSGYKEGELSDDNDEIGHNGRLSQWEEASQSREVDENASSAQ
jgi:hypothetical protein